MFNITVDRYYGGYIDVCIEGLPSDGEIAYGPDEDEVIRRLKQLRRELKRAIERVKAF
ncbi:hypothetical protein ABZ470_31865 [Streptosporangium sp. NPDC020072]|uniref:hypothetical protein n=1 Tax=Streptosporangium sp. NPDC020072 TaxID=3154788 RepID=UPI00344798C8